MNLLFLKIPRAALVIFTLSALLPSTRAAATNPSRPNILLVVADDLGVQVGCYGDPVARTPEIDRFAMQGTRFTTAYVTQSSCSPSRSSLLTGLFPHQNGQIGLANRGYSMKPGIATLPAMLKQAHYRTGIIGKLHVNPEDAFPFDYAEKSPAEARDVRLVAERAKKFWADSKGEPWFLMVNFFDPHTPFITQHKGLPEVPYQAKNMKPFPFQQVDLPEELEHIAGYYNGVGRVDAGLGMLLKHLEETGQAENTLVIFMGDNGAPFVRAKTNGTEAGLRVPFIVRWPKAPQAAVVTDSLVSGADVVPTFLEIAGLPANPALSGRSFLPILGKKNVPLHDYLFAEHNAHRRDMYFPQRIVRDGRYKLVLNLKEERDFGIEVDDDPAAKILNDPAWAHTPAQHLFQLLRTPPPEEFYDLGSDPEEMENLIDRPQHRATIERLRQALQNWREATRDPLLDPAFRAAERKAHPAIKS